MASIESLLNPLPSGSPAPRGQDDPAGGDALSTPAYNTQTNERHRAAYNAPRAKKPKLPKDAPIFTRGKVRGELRYPPHEYQDAELAAEHRRFQIHPMGHIAEFPRHIPYNSEKKSFLDKTGRESFEGGKTMVALFLSGGLDN